MEASERDEFSRVAWRALVAERLDAGRLVFVDEMGARIPRFRPSTPGRDVGSGHEARWPRNRGTNATLLASMTLKGMRPCLAVVESTTKEAFEAYVEQVLAPVLVAGQVVVLDNLVAHKGERGRELIEEKGCELLFVPAYSPDFDPIEQAFSKVKTLLRRAGSRTREALLVEGMAER